MASTLENISDTVQDFLGVRGTTDPSELTYIQWNGPEVEPEIANEKAQVDELAGIIKGISEKHFSTHRHGSRVTHVKTQAIAKGTLTIPKDLPPHLAQGLFSRANAGDHPVAFRFANEPIFIQDDRAPGPRGFGMKVFDVKSTEGFLDDIGAQTNTHDMTFNNAPILELRDLPTTVEIFKLRSEYYDDHEGLQKELNKRSDRNLQLAPQKLPNHHFMAYQFYSQSAYRFGDYIAKFSVAPGTEFQEALASKASITDNSDPEQHSEWLQQYFRENDAEFEVKAQLCSDISRQPVEDCSVEWDEKRFPFQTVGHITIPKGQDVFSPERRIFWDDGMKLNPWYGLKEHQPLGSVNRLRKVIYQTSLGERTTLNARAPKAISSIDEIP